MNAAGSTLSLLGVQSYQWPNCHIKQALYIPRTAEAVRRVPSRNAAITITFVAVVVVLWARKLPRRVLRICIPDGAGCWLSVRVAIPFTVARRGADIVWIIGTRRIGPISVGRYSDRQEYQSAGSQTDAASSIPHGFHPPLKPTGLAVGKRCQSHLHSQAIPTNWRFVKLPQLIVCRASESGHQRTSSSIS